MKAKGKSFPKKLIIITAVLFVAVTGIELCVIHFSPLNRLIGGYEEFALDLTSCEGANITYNSDGSVSLGSGYSRLEFESVGKRVGSVGFDFDGSFNQSRVNISVTDETSSEYRFNLVNLTLDDNEENIVVCNLSGDVGKLCFDFQMNFDEPVTLRSITLNKSISARETFVIVFIFLAVAVGVAVMIYLFFGSESAHKRFSEKKSFCTRTAVIITVCVMFFSLFTTVNFISKGWSNCYDSFTSQQGDQLTKELVDAFEHGQVSLLEKPSDDLLAMDNPYEYIKRSTDVSSFLWDHCLYNGKYYSYYGIGPVIALFLPYHLITGYYFPSAWATLLFSLVGIMFLTKIYLAVIEKKFSSLPCGTVLMGLVTLLMSSGIFFSSARSLFYEIAISAGFMCITIGTYLLLSSNILWEGKLSYLRLGFASFFLGYAVLCRPTLAVYCIAALLFMALGLKKALQSKEKSKKTKTFFKYAAVALVPLGVLALVQMTYNYLRFDNPLDFGIQYSLTINDFTHAEFHWKFVLINMWAYLFNMPHFSPTEFPYIASSVERFALNGYMYIDDANVNLVSVGLIFRALPVISYLFAGKALKLTEKKKRLPSALLIGVTCVLMPLIIIFISWESGYAVRYNADFSWQMVIGALVIAFTIYKNIKSESTKKLVDIIFVTSTVLCVYVNVAQVLAFMRFSPIII